MAFNFSRSDGFNPKDFATFIDLEEDTEINECNLFINVNALDSGLTLSLDTEVGQFVIVSNIGDGLSFTLKLGETTESIDDGEAVMVVHQTDYVTIIRLG